MDVEQLIGSVIQGALGGKRKKSRGVTRFLTGGKSSFLNASTLLALGGLAWGVYETMTQSAGTPATPPGSTPAAPRPVASGPVVPPPLPTAGAVVPPPLPGAAAPAVSPEVLRVLRLTLSAASADGVLSANERDAILAQARSVGAEAIVTPELEAPRLLAEIAGGSPTLECAKTSTRSPSRSCAPTSRSTKASGAISRSWHGTWVLMPPP